MDRQALRRLRAVRGAAASVATTVLAATAHTFAGAGAPSLVLVAVAAVLAAPLAVALVGRRPSAVRTSAAVVGAQVVFHLLFALFADPDAVVYSPAAGMIGHAAGHATPTMTMAHPASAAHDMAPGSPMTLAHLAAALVTIVVLHRGERMLRALHRGIRRLLPRLVVVAPRPAVPRRLFADFSVVARPVTRLASVLSRRGPPLPVG